MVQSNWVGQTLGGRYKIEELLGQGGMSAVYKATDPNLRRVVAVKLIHPHLSDNTEFVSRFEEEAAVVAQLRHPNIVQVFDFDKDGDTYYMVLEFVPGETLQDRLERLEKAGRGLDFKEAVRYGINICEAVDYAHKRNMIHRDIKPANVMLDVQGQAILTDFGIARIVGGQRHTATGAVIGTALYMAPEQIRGENPDHRADLYAVGVTLFEMVSGQPPYQADSAMTLMMMHLNDPVPNLRLLRPGVPEDLVAVIEKALAKDRNQRFQTGAEMARALKNVLARMEGRPVSQPLTPTASQPGYQTSPTAGDVGPGGTVVIQPTGGPSVAAGAAGAVAGTEVIGRTAAPARKQNLTPFLLIGGAGLVFLLIACLAGYFLLAPARRVARASATPTETATLEATATTSEAATSTAVATTPASAMQSLPTDTPAPTLSPTPVASPTQTIPAGIPYVLITNITLDGNTYVVEYETFEYTEQLPGMHVHFFFNTVTQENAGSPGSGPWKLYGGPRPFRQYATNNRPAAATQMCALVANSNHSIQFNSGNCFPLPDVPQP